MGTNALSRNDRAATSSYSPARLLEVRDKLIQIKLLRYANLADQPDELKNLRCNAKWPVPRSEQLLQQSAALPAMQGKRQAARQRPKTAAIGQPPRCCASADWRPP